MKPLLIVDGYNVIGAWSEAEKGGWSIEESRDRLLHILQDYGGYIDEDIVLVFDGYLSDRRVRTEEQYGPVTLVFTRRNETADSYIERLVAETPRYRSVRVATSDGLEQVIILGGGALRESASEFRREVEAARVEISRILEKSRMGREKDAPVARAYQEALEKKKTDQGGK
jgi:predicted RNA-binding protein with PIN domain